MNTALLLVSAAAALSLVALLVSRRRAAQTASPAPVRDAAGPATEVIWRRGAGRAELGAAANAKRAFIRQVALGSVASMTGWVAARGTNAEWAEKLILSQTKTTAAGKGKALLTTVQRAMTADRPLHQDDHYDYITHHYDLHADGNDLHTDENPHTDDSPHTDGIFHDHIDEWVYIGEGGENGFAHQDWTNVGGHTDDTPHTDETPHNDAMSHQDIMIDFVDHADFEA